MQRLNGFFATYESSLSDRLTRNHLCLSQVQVPVYRGSLRRRYRCDVRYQTEELFTVNNIFMSNQYVHFARRERKITWIRGHLKMCLILDNVCKSPGLESLPYSELVMCSVQSKNIYINDFKDKLY